MKSEAKDRSSGFTLIELLVVIAIIGILSSVVLVSVNGARQKGYEARSALDARTIETANEEYYQAHGDWAPSGASADYTTGPAGNWNTIASTLSTFLGAMPTPGFPTVVDGSGNVYQGYVYSKGTAANPRYWSIYDGVTMVRCVKVYKGYWLDLLMPTQTYLTRNDRGFDPDGIETYAGDVRAVEGNVPCP